MSAVRKHGTPNFAGINMRAAERWMTSCTLLKADNVAAKLQLGAGRGGAVGKRSRMRPGLPDHFNMRLQRPLLGDDKAGTDITHVDVRVPRF